MGLWRWMLVPLSAIAVWYAVLVAGVIGISVLDRLCPLDLMVSGLCTASWHAPAVDALVLLCTAVVSAAIVLVPASIAPARRVAVAAAAFGCGAIFAVTAVVDGGVWGPFAIAGVSGSAALWAANRQWATRRRRGT